MKFSAKIVAKKNVAFIINLQYLTGCWLDFQKTSN